MFGHDNDQTSNNTADEGAASAQPTTDSNAGGYLDNIAPTSPTEPATAPEPATSTPTNNTDELLDLKQQALQQLTPLVGHLEQSPEEKFRTNMMLIQASDNANLIHEAYSAALQIPDEKVRAQALLDIVNEINYFTQQNNA